MKVCSNCGLKKSADGFYKRKNGALHGSCKACLLKTQKDRWKSRKVKAVDMFGGKCVNCGYSRNVAALDFHHLNPDEKEFNWNRLCKRPWAEVITELKKCTLFCRNCHAEFHHPQCFVDKLTGDHANRSLDEDVVVVFRTLGASGKCPQCQRETYGTKYCTRECAQKSKRRVVRPTKEQLEKEIIEMSWLALGRKYNVSDNAVRKWARHYKIIKALK